jgi:hypothetical protein
MNPPFDRSYWVVPGTFCAGIYPGDHAPALLEMKMRALLDCGIRHIINLMEIDETDFSGRILPSYKETWQDLAVEKGYGVSVSRFPIRDMGIPGVGRMKKVLDDIDRSLSAALPVYLHCWGGIGRTGTVVGCWLARHEIALGNNALTMIDELRRHTANFELASPQTGDQRYMIVEWKKGE